MAAKSLHARKNNLSEPNEQLRFLSNGIFADGKLPSFAEKLKTSEQFPLKPNTIEILQINVGYMCNQVCAHLPCRCWSRP